MTSDRLRQDGATVQPIMQPAVPERSARLRFFISSLHDRPQIARVVALTADALAKAGRGISPIELAARLAAG